MAALTAPKCATECGPRYGETRCCEPMYCDIVQETLDTHGIKIATTTHPKLKFMGENGCVVPPAYRPVCAIHVCSIANMGFDKDPVFTSEYFKLREKISLREQQEVINEFLK